MAEEKVLRVIEEDFKPTCLCAERTCGPHRCGPSRWGWVGVGGLLIYAIVMHSFHMNDLAELRGTFKAEVLAKAQAMTEVALNTAQGEIWGRMQTFLAASHTLLQTAKADFDTRLEAIPPLLARAERLTWAVATPEVERDVQLKQAIERLQGH